MVISAVAKRASPVSAMTKVVPSRVVSSTSNTLSIVTGLPWCTLNSPGTVGRGIDAVSFRRIFYFRSAGKKLFKDTAL